MAQDPLKRVLDAVVAAAALVVLFVPLVAVALLVLVVMGSPVLFRHVRAGKDGKPFVLVKFRTMRDLRDASGRPLPDEVRLTPIGRVLRATSIDELPQLVNVLRGEMSLVGPRPLLVEYVGRYSLHQARRLHVRPGITGWSQVRGRNGLSWDERFDLDVWYVEHRSLRVDLAILLRTLGAVAARRGVKPRDRETMPEFQGGRT